MLNAERRTHNQYKAKLVSHMLIYSHDVIMSLFIPCIICILCCTVSCTQKDNNNNII